MKLNLKHVESVIALGGYRIANLLKGKHLSHSQCEDLLLSFTTAGIDMKLAVARIITNFWKRDALHLAVAFAFMYECGMTQECYACILGMCTHNAHNVVIETIKQTVWNFCPSICIYDMYGNVYRKRICIKEYASICSISSVEEKRIDHHRLTIDDALRNIMP